MLTNGNAIFGWHIGYEQPALVRTREAFQQGLHITMGREVPVPNEHHWAAWMVAHVEHNNALLLPVLWQDLGNFKYLQGCDALDVVTHIPVLAKSEIGIWFAALLGKAIWRSLDDLIKLQIPDQRQIDSKLAHQFAVDIGKLGTDKPKNKWLNVRIRYQDEYKWFIGNNNQFHHDKVGAKVLNLSEAIKIADDYDGNVVCAIPTTYWECKKCV